MSIFRKIPVLDGSMTVPPMKAGDEHKLFYNPDRGLRHQIDYHMRADYTPVRDAVMDEAHALVARHAEFFAGVHPTLAQFYVYLTDYNECEVLPESVFDRLRSCFSALRDYGLRALLRFTYQTDMGGTGEASEEIMCAHMDQLFPVVAENLDVIHVYQAGFLGAWGEWHSNKLPVDSKRLLEHILDTCPPSLFVQMRLPQFKNLIDERDVRKRRLSHHNDSVFGEEHTATGGVNPGTEHTLQVERECPYLPIDGELFWGKWSINGREGFFPDPFKVLHWLYEQRYTSLSAMHNYQELGPEKPLAMSLWSNIPLSAEYLREHGMLCDGEYFGERGKRSVFEYLRDHLGYRIKAEELNVSTLDGALAVSLNAVNYGFAAPHMITEAGFALLDGEGTVVSDAPCGGISHWHPRSPEKDAKEALVHNACATLGAPAGEYYLAFYARNNAGTPVRLANDVIFESGMNIFGKVEIFDNR